MSTYGDDIVCSINDMLEKTWSRLLCDDKAAKKAKTLVGRYITQPMGDGRAVYQIIKETKRTVTIRHVPGACADDWIIPYWGTRATVRRAWVEQEIRGHEAMDEMFSAKGAS